jgi:hypothetical protein
MHKGTCTRFCWVIARTVHHGDRAGFRQFGHGLDRLGLYLPAYDHADDRATGDVAEKYFWSYHWLFSAARWSRDAMGPAVFAWIQPFLRSVVGLHWGVYWQHNSPKVTAAWKAMWELYTAGRLVSSPFSACPTPWQAVICHSGEGLTTTAQRARRWRSERLEAVGCRLEARGMKSLFVPTAYSLLVP